MDNEVSQNRPLIHESKEKFMKQKDETIMEQLIREAQYAQRSFSRELLMETYGKAEMARQLKAISFAEFMKINNLTVYFINTHARDLSI